MPETFFIVCDDAGLGHPTKNDRGEKCQRHFAGQSSLESFAFKDEVVGSLKASRIPHPHLSWHIVCYTSSMKYEAALFDMDGVILDSEPLHAAAFQAALGQYGHELSEGDYKKYFAGKTDEAGFESYFKFLNEAVDMPMIIDEKARKYLELAGDQLAPYPGITQTIRQLATRIPLALVTGSLKAEAEVALKTFEITDCFKVIIAAEDVSQSKPNPEGYNKAAEQLGVPNEKCVVIEDSPSGIKAAVAAGVDCIAVTNTHSADELLEATKIVDLVTIAEFEA